MALLSGHTQDARTRLGVGKFTRKAITLPIAQLPHSPLNRSTATSSSRGGVGGRILDRQKDKWEWERVGGCVLGVEWWEMEIGIIGEWMGGGLRYGGGLVE